MAALQPSAMMSDTFVKTSQAAERVQKGNTSPPAARQTARRSVWARRRLTSVCEAVTLTLPNSQLLTRTCSATAIRC